MCRQEETSIDMIPKKIHYTWFSGEPFPELVEQCIQSWHQYMPEYEYVLWDAQRIANIDSLWLKQCIEKKKWAFAADFVRLYAVYTEGGIYLDTDCMAYHSFDPLLNNVSFIGKEHSIHVEGRRTEMYLTSHCFGAEKGDWFVGRVLSYYNNRPFITSADETLPMRLKYNTEYQPFIHSEIAKQMGYDPFPSADAEQHLEHGVVVYPSRYFDSTNQTTDTYIRHLALGSWREQKMTEDSITWQYKIKWRLEAVLRRFVNSLGYMLIKKL